MFRAKVFPSFSEAAESARWIAQKASSDVVVRAVEDGWMLEIEALRKIEEAFLRDILAGALAEDREDLFPAVDQSGDRPLQSSDPDVICIDGDSMEAVNDRWSDSESDWVEDDSLVELVRA